MFVNISSTSDISSTATYKLINSWSLWPLALDPTQPDLQLRALSNNDTALEFQFRQSDEPAKFNICAAVGGQTYCLDVFNQPKDVPHMTPWGYYSGQYWSIDANAGSVKLSNDWTGPGWYLDVFQGSLAAHLTQASDNTAGQFWMLDRVAENVTLPPEAPDVGTVTTLAPKEKEGGSSGLSTPAIIGISLGGGIFSAAFLLAVLALLFRRRRRRLKRLGQQNAAIAAGMPPCENRDQLVRTPNSRTGLDPMSSTLGSAPSNTGGTAITPQEPHFNGLPPELESPMAAHHGTNPHHGGASYFPNGTTAASAQQQRQQQRSIYELPGNHEDQILPAPQASYTSLNHKYHNPDEKDPTLFITSTATTNTTDTTSTTPASPASSTITGSRRTAGPRWEEVVPDGNGEITFSTIPRTTMSSSPPPHPAAAGGSVPATTLFPRNIAGIAYGFGGGGGMAGGAAPGYMGAANTAAVPSTSARERWANGTWSSDGRGSSCVSNGSASPGGYGGGGGGNDGASELDGMPMPSPPPRYTDPWGATAVHEADGIERLEAGGREVIRLADAPGPGVMREVVRLADLGAGPEREVVRLVDLPPSPERERGNGGGENGRDWPAVGSMRR